MIESLNTHYSFTTPASIHDEEALTALELAGRQAAKINEVIDSQNKLLKDVENEKKVVIPATIKNEVQKNIDNGTFDNAIDEYAGGLEIRVNNLLGRVTEGSTTMDAEVIDARIGVTNEVYNNLGEALRQQLQKRACYGKVFSNVAPIVSRIDGVVTLTIKPTMHIFFNDRRYDISSEMSTSTSSDVLLYNVAFNVNSREISLMGSTVSLNAPLIHIGIIYRDCVYFNDWAQSDTGLYPLHDTPLYVSTWCNTRPHAEKIDDLNFRLHFPQFYIYLNRKSVTVEEQTVTVARKSTTNSLHYVLYNIHTGAISILFHGDRVPGQCVVIGFFNYMTMSINLLGQDYHHANPKQLCAFIGGIKDKYIKFDGLNKTIKIPDDTLIMAATQGGATYYQLADSKGNTSVSWADQTSSALCLYFNRDDESLIIEPYNARVSDNLLLMCSFRTNTGIVSINYPYMWNGKLYNTIPINASGDVTLTATALSFDTINSVNHRGYNVSAPENTLAAFKLSKINGFDKVECDVSFTSDGIGVLLHDDTIDRTSNGSGIISSMTLADVKQYDFGSWFSTEYAGEKIPTFTEFIALCKKLSLHPYIEIKANSAVTQEQVTGLVNTVKSYGLIDKVTWISFSNVLLEYVQTAHSSARLGFVCSLSDSAINTALSLKNTTNEVFLDCDKTTLTDTLINKCVEKSLPVEVWTVNDSSTVLSLDPYVSGITSDTIHAGKTLYEANI